MHAHRARVPDAGMVWRREANLDSQASKSPLAAAWAAKRSVMRPSALSSPVTACISRKACFSRPKCFCKVSQLHRRTSTECQGSQQCWLGIMQVAPSAISHTAPKRDTLAAGDCPEEHCGVPADLAHRGCATTLSLSTHCLALHFTFSLSASPGSFAGGGSNSRW